MLTYGANILLIDLSTLHGLEAKQKLISLSLSLSLCVCVCVCVCVKVLEQRFTKLIVNTSRIPGLNSEKGLLTMRLSNEIVIHFIQTETNSDSFHHYFRIIDDVMLYVTVSS